MGNSMREKIELYSQITICTAGALALSFIFFKYLLPLVLPFLIAWGIAFLTRPIAAKINSIVRIPVRVIRPILALVLFISIMGLASYLVIKLAGEAWQLLSGLGENTAVSEVIRKVFESITDFFGESENARALEEYLIRASSSLITSLLSSIGTAVTSVAASVPGFIIFLLVTVISSVYFSSDLENINKSIKKLLPKKILEWCTDFKDNSLKIAAGYMKSYFFIMLITFSIMLLGMVVLRVRYALLIALVVAVLDILPVLGIGTVLIPWGGWSIISGDKFLGVGLLVLFAVAEIIRQVVEPRIVGHSLGIHPIITLVLLYACYSAFGIVGIILLPFFAILVKTLIEKSDSSKIV